MSGPAQVEVAGWRLRFAEPENRRRSLGLGPFLSEEGSADLSVDSDGRVARIRLSDSEPVRWQVALAGQRPESALAIALTVQAALTGALVFHCAALLHAGRALLALAPSGGGKSTFATLLRDLPLFSDEFNVVRRGEDGSLAAFATPLRSSCPRGPNALSAPLGALLFLAKSDESRLEPLDPAQALRLLSAQAVSPDVPSLKPPFPLLAELARRTPAFRFHFRKDPSCRRLLDELPRWS